MDQSYVTKRSNRLSCNTEYWYLVQMLNREKKRRAALEPCHGVHIYTLPWWGVHLSSDSFATYVTAGAAVLRFRSVFKNVCLGGVYHTAVEPVTRHACIIPLRDS